MKRADIERRLVEQGYRDRRQAHDVRAHLRKKQPDGADLGEYRLRRLDAKLGSERLLDAIKRHMGRQAR